MSGRISITVVRKHLKYVPETGLLFWKVRRKGNCPKGKIAGSLKPSGYIAIGLNNKTYQAHRLAWMLTYGEMPKGEIDHINGIRTDNRLSNLRDVSKKENQKNKRLSSLNKSKVSGVFFRKESKKWIAFIKVSQIKIHLGTFEYWFDAVCAKKSAEYKYGFHINHGKKICHPARCEA